MKEKPKAYWITKKFIGGPLKGLTWKGPTSVKFEVGFVCQNPTGNTSPHEIISVEENKPYPEPEWAYIGEEDELTELGMTRAWKCNHEDSVAEIDFESGLCVNCQDDAEKPKGKLKHMSTETKTEQAGAKHTPAPWTVDRHRGEGVFAECQTSVYDSNDREICDTSNLQIEPDECEANAKLIALAPTMAAELAETKAQRDALLASCKALLARGSFRRNDADALARRASALIAIAEAGRAQ